jgi:hypothetical protein
MAQKRADVHFWFALLSQCYLLKKQQLSSNAIFSSKAEEHHPEGPDRMKSMSEASGRASISPPRSVPLLITMPPL